MPEWRKRLDGYKIQPVLAIQIWGNYTFGEKVYRPDAGNYEPVDDRMEIQLRRTRIGFKAQPTERFSFQIIAAMDQVGKDVLSGGTGGPNNGAQPQFGLWDGYFQWRMSAKSDVLHLTGGYFRPQFGRESITSGLRTTSHEKAWQQRYIREHIVGTNPGRATGLNLGGLHRKEGSRVAFSYDVGVFVPLFTAYNGNSSGEKTTPLAVGRLSLHLGDPEFEQYTINRKINYFGKRKGLTISAQGSSQGQTDLFKTNRAWAADMLFNWGPINLDGEWAWLQREGSGTAPVASQTGHLRASYNFVAGKKYLLEPAIMYYFFKGEMDAATQATAKVLKSATGEESALDVGLNFYFDPDFKISLHYTHRNGNPGDAGNGATVNDYFYQKEIGAIHRGDWLGAGLVVFF